MELTTAERFVLIAARTSRDGGPGNDREQLETAARRRYEIEHDERPLDLAGAIDGLLARGQLVRDQSGTRYVLAQSAVTLAQQLNHESWVKNFDEWMLASAASRAYARFCERVYGLPVIQFGMVDREQMDAMVEAMDARSSSRVIDLGCGVGHVSEYLADRTGAHVTGVDFAPGAIAGAIERTRSKADRLRFVIDDLNHLAQPRGTFDLALSLDTLYFVDDLEKTVGDILALLAPQGRLVAFMTCIRKTGEDESVLAAETSKLARALTSHGCTFTTRDFTENERRLWTATRGATAELRSGFELEGNTKLARSRDWESTEMLETYAAGHARRYLYVARR